MEDDVARVPPKTDEMPHKDTGVVVSTVDLSAAHEKESGKEYVVILSGITVTHW
jgi:hypothetical protein